MAQRWGQGRDRGDSDPKSKSDLDEYRLAVDELMRPHPRAKAPSPSNGRSDMTVFINRVIHRIRNFGFLEIVLIILLAIVTLAMVVMAVCCTTFHQSDSTYGMEVWWRAEETSDMRVPGGPERESNKWYLAVVTDLDKKIKKITRSR